MPSRPRPEEPAAEPELRTDTERPVEERDSERERRPETERRDCEERDDVRELARELLLLELPEPREPLPPDVIPVGGEPTDPAGDTTGARPHMSQYSSPPPMSSYDPEQPGRWQFRCSPTDC
jgi:hypothetical protein